MILWLFIAVLAAYRQCRSSQWACYFLHSSQLMSGQEPPIGIMGIILPIYTIIDMIETAEKGLE